MWRYQDLLNQNLQIMLVLGLGALSVFTRIFRQDTDLKVFNKFVFMILLPASVLLGLGLKSDLRDGALWKFIGAFLMMRAINLLACAVLFGGGLRRSLGHVTVTWLCTSWVSSVILGVPLIRATLGAQYANLGVVAGISSFIFQLPVMLILLETHAGRQVLPEAAAPDQSDKAAPTEAPAKWLTQQQWRSIGGRLVTNPVLWAIVGGLVLSLSHVGPKYLNPGNPPVQPNCNYEPAAGFINLLLSSLAACTEPVALFATGVFLVHKNPLACGTLQAGGFMLAKLVLVPALMVGCATALGLEGATARAAVLLAALPISAASFTLTEIYHVGQDIVVSNIFFGNLLVLPTTILWSVFMDGVGLFPTQDGIVPPVCAAPPPAAAALPAAG